ncbi:uncharacterized protein MELLADRAFT_77818 [Melampsora larici-populina 98AG31]|uniref:TBP-associated factor 4 n=1 Tax=Melampsora larici-populina (strain 98AG31 / pathotype 3-4-7) TaxID=747676 RepID=F4RMA2_MELLP|nr:uncharacterized protein MELLADRAFT_77818 [Melampsora larici-populina 98AG31]EGG06387.1 hypothetical protein MELLADRAFT_77818 [Melampsora larici-populina 98AG31]
MYDEIVYEEPERILSILARVEGEEERKARLEREQELQEDGNPSQSQAQSHETRSVSIPLISNEPLPPDLMDEKSNLKKEKKRKREGPGQQARNMSEDARARQSNQTAMRSVGGRSKYSWLSGGLQASQVPTPTSGSELQGTKSSLNFTPTSILASLPAPKFAPQSNPQNLSKQTSTVQSDSDSNLMTDPIGKDQANSSLLNPTGTTNQTRNQTGAGTGGQMSRLGGLIPASHLAVQETGKVGLKDSLFALERERGTGAGRGTGSRVVFKTYLNSSSSSSNAL